MRAPPGTAVSFSPRATRAFYARLRRAMEKVGMRGPLRESEPHRIVERPPHPRRVLVFRFAGLPSPRKRGEVRRTRQVPAGGATSASGWLLRLSASATKPE